jgi:alkylation response protein AidB-like acyl-CoA dehydrogenase
MIKTIYGKYKMNFDLSEERKMLVETLRKFVSQECSSEFARQIDENETFPHELYKKMAELGLMRQPFPSKYGGLDGDIIDEVLIIEELSKASAAIGLTYFLSTCFGGKSLEFFGIENQKRCFFPKLFSGETMFSLSLTEPGGARYPWQP